MTDRDENLTGAAPGGDSGFDDIEALLREMSTADAELTPPPSDLWDRIAADALGDGADEAGTREGVRRAVPAEQPPASQGATVHPIEHRRRRWIVPALAGAAAVILLVAGFVVVSQTGDDSSTVVARAELTYDPDNFDALGATAIADAELIERDDGTAAIELVDASLPSTGAEDADLEAWLILPDAEGGVADIVSLGVVDPDDPGTLEIPDSYDPAEFFVVDISVEPRDGVPTHSGRSILRGPLVQA